MGSYVSKHRLGVLFIAPTDVVLSMIDTVQPDILFVAERRLRIVATNNVALFPHLVAEVVSPPQFKEKNGSNPMRQTIGKDRIFQEYPKSLRGLPKVVCCSLHWPRHLYVPLPSGSRRDPFERPLHYNDIRL